MTEKEREYLTASFNYAREEGRRAGASGRPKDYDHLVRETTPDEYKAEWDELYDLHYEFGVQEEAKRRRNW